MCFLEANRYHTPSTPVGTRDDKLLQLVGTALFVFVKSSVLGAIRNVEATTRKVILIPEDARRVYM